MNKFNPSLLKQLYIPHKASHKGENGKLLLIGGSKLFHAASLWALTVASRVVDMVFYSSIPENNEIVASLKHEFRNGIVIKRSQIDSYIQEADCILIGPGLPRASGQEEGDDDTQTLTERLLTQHKDKKWVIDGGSLQVISPEILPNNSIITPHKKEFDLLKFNPSAGGQNLTQRPRSGQELEEQVEVFAKEYRSVVLLKGETDIVCSPEDCVRISGGNSGMTKGGTGDVLAGLTAALYCKNSAFLSAAAASYINKRAGEELFRRVGYYFNASDLADEIPKVMKQLLVDAE